MRLPSVVTRLAAGAVLAGLISVLLAVPAAAGADETATREEFLSLLNGARGAAGLPPLRPEPLLGGVAQEWSQVMASQDRLYHRPDLAHAVSTKVTTGWTRVGENVGVGESVGALHRAFLASPSHHANVVGDYNRVGIGVVARGSDIWVTFNFMQTPATVSAASRSAGDFLLVGKDGSVSTFGGVAFEGALTGQQLASPLVGAATTSRGRGYWLVASDGGIFAFGDAGFHGSTGAIPLNRPIVGIAPTPSGRGYWLVASDGGIFAFGDAGFHGSTGAIPLNRPIVGIAPTPSGRGYWLVASDGGIFAFGDAGFHGSTASHQSGAPIIQIGSSPSGRGYHLASADGTVHAFGDAAPGVSGGVPTDSPIVAFATRT